MHSLLKILIRHTTSFTRDSIKPGKEETIVSLSLDECTVVAGGPQVDNDPES
jgi:hypothetical protein